jgi:hypothetical protein
MSRVALSGVEDVAFMLRETALTIDDRGKAREAWRYKPSFLWMSLDFYFSSLKIFRSSSFRKSQLQSKETKTNGWINAQS